MMKNFKSARSAQPRARLEHTGVARRGVVGDPCFKGILAAARLVVSLFGCRLPAADQES